MFPEAKLRHTKALKSCCQAVPCGVVWTAGSKRMAMRHTLFIFEWHVVGRDGKPLKRRIYIGAAFAWSIALIVACATGHPFTGVPASILGVYHQFRR